MTNGDKFDELIARAPTLTDKARLVRTNSLMSPIVSRMEYLPYGEFETVKADELEASNAQDKGQRENADKSRHASMVL